MSPTGQRSGLPPLPQGLTLRLPFKLASAHLPAQACAPPAGICPFVPVVSSYVARRPSILPGLENQNQTKTSLGNKTGNKL